MKEARIGKITWEMQKARTWKLTWEKMQEARIGSSYFGNAEG